MIKRSNVFETNLMYQQLTAGSWVCIEYHETGGGFRQKRQRRSRYRRSALVGKAPILLGTR